MNDERGRIVADGLTKSFGTVKAVDALSFTVEPGSVTGFLGPNGAGETTTLRLLLGLVTPDTGTATISGHACAALPAPVTEVGAALEATGFHPARSGRDHLRVYCTVSGLDRHRADDVLDQVGLTEAGRRKVGGYSLGMRQRLALATALLGDPSVLVLDEPANGLDPEGIAWMRRLLRGRRGQDRPGLQPRAHGGPAARRPRRDPQPGARRAPRNARRHIQHTDGHLGAHPAPRRAGRRPHPSVVNGVSVVRTGPETLTVSGKPSTEIGRIAWQERIELHELTPQRSDLEQLFFSLTSADPEETR